MTNVNPFDVFDFTPEDVEQAQEEIRAKIVTKDGRVCICGHPMGRHSEAGIRDGVVLDVCTGNKGNNCQCKRRREVIRVDNARNFLRKTIGSGALHALSQGMADAMTPKVKKDRDGNEVLVPAQNIEWLIEPKCDVCGAEDAISPCCVNERNQVVEIDVKAFPPTKYVTKFLCKKCRLGE